MANYCPSCGKSVDSDAAFCKSCGKALNGSDSNYSNNSSSSKKTSDILGTLVTVSLIGGLTKRLYFHNGRYFLDPHCRRPFVGPGIIGPHHNGGPHGGPHRGPGGFGGPHGGSHGGPGGH